MHKIFVKEFAEFPGPRYIKLGDYSGEEFRDTMLIPAIKEYGDVSVVLDGAYSYGSSFLEEAFGGIVRLGIPKRQVLFVRDNLVSKDDDSLITEIQSYIDDALKAKK